MTCKCGRHMEGKIALLPGEISWTQRANLQNAVETRFIMRRQIMCGSNKFNMYKKSDTSEMPLKK